MRDRTRILLLFLVAAAACLPAAANAAGFTPGNVYVADRPVREFTPGGALVRTFLDPSLQQPVDLAFDPAGRELYVTDVLAGDVKVLDGSGTVVRTFGGDHLVRPRGLAIDPSGNVYVADVAAGAVEVFDAAGTHLRTIAAPAAVNVALSSDASRLFVSASLYSSGVLVFDLSDGDRALGPFGQTASDVLLTAGLATSSEGSLYVGDVAFGSGTVELFAPDGSRARTLATGLKVPTDLTLDRDGNLWLTNTNDFGGEQLRAYDPAGNLIAAFGSGLLLQPTGVAVHRGDTTPPFVSARLAGTLGTNGWFVSDVTVEWDVVDPESSATACSASTITADTPGTTISCTATSAGGSTTSAVAVKRDATAPTIAYTGNQGTYAVTDVISIVCTAADALSGVASNTCVDVSGPAWSFGAGTFTVAATATDAAGNTASGSATFEVSVSASDLCALATGFAGSAARTTGLCHQLADATGGSPAAEAARAAAAHAVDALERSSWVTPEQAAVLRGLTASLR